MSIKFLPLIDYDKMFYDDPDAKIIPYGLKTYISSKQVKTFMDDIFKEDVGDLQFSASCECGHLSGNYCIGSICNLCNTEVREAFADELKFQAWIEIPEYIPPLLHPVAFRVFRKWLGNYERKPLIDLILDSTADLPEDLAVNVGCGLRNFYERFDKIVNYLLNDYKPLQKGTAKNRSEHIPQFIKMYKHCMFIRHLPVLNHNLSILTSRGTMKLTDESSQHVFKAIVELSNLAYTYNTDARPELYLEQHASAVYYSYLEYVKSIVYDKLTKKPGFIRRHILGTRCHFSFRGVIVPITIPHVGDELHLPWRIAVSGLKLEIINLLQNRHDLPLNMALDKWHTALFMYDEEIDQIIKTLIDECSKKKHKNLDGSPLFLKGLPVTFGRNP